MDRGWIVKNVKSESCQMCMVLFIQKSEPSLDF